MTDPFIHDEATGADNHGPYVKVFADAQARLDDVTPYEPHQSLASGENPIKALQLSDGSEYYLASILPNVWTPVTATTDHGIIGPSHTGFPGGVTDFLRADGTFAAPVSAAENFTTAGMVVKTNTNGEIGAFNDISTEMISESGSDIDVLAGTGAGNVMYVGGDAPPPGLLVDGTIAAALGAGAMIAEVWKGSWTEVKTMSAKNDGSQQFNNAAILQRTGKELIFFGDTTGWITKLLDGDTKYYWRLRVVVAITTVPRLESVKLHLDSVRVDENGLVFLGTARPRLRIAVERNKDKVDGAKNQEIQWSANITQDVKDNKFEGGALMRTDSNLVIPEGMDTSKPATVRLSVQQADAGAGNVEALLTKSSPINDGSVLDGSVTDVTQSQIFAVPNSLDVVAFREFPIDLSDFVPGDILALSSARDAQPANGNDTFGGDMYITRPRLVGFAWRA